MSLSVVVPCYRSAATLPALVARLHDVLPAQAADFEILLVVDGHAETWTTAAELDRGSQYVRALPLSRNFGQHNALLAGVRAARHDVIVTMDDDLQHRPEEIPTLLAALAADADLVYGVAVEEEHGAARSFASRLVKAGLTHTMRVDGAGRASAFRAFRTFLRDGFTDLHGPHVCLDVALSWATTNITSVPVTMDERQHGRSGYTFRALVRHTSNMVLGYSTAPLRLVTYLGVLVGALGLVLAGRMLYLYFSGGTTVAGFTTIACMVALFSAAQMIATGVLGEYLGRLHANGLGRPAYVVRPTGTAPADTAPARRSIHRTSQGSPPMTTV